MPRKLDVAEIPARATQRFEERYAVEDYLDGGVWEWKAGRDFDVKPSTFYQGLRTYAKRKGIKLATSERGEVVLMQALNGQQ